MNIKRKRKCFYFSKLKHVYFNVIEHTEISIKWSHCLYVQSNYWIQMDQNQWPSVSYRCQRFKTVASKRVGSTSIYRVIATYWDVNSTFKLKFPFLVWEEEGRDIDLAMSLKKINKFSTLARQKTHMSIVFLPNFMSTVMFAR